MKAYRRESPEENFTLSENATVPIPQAGEALIKVLRAGICATDLEIIKGYKNGRVGTLGHEFVGKIVKINGFSDKFVVGTRVVAEINICCDKASISRCRTCQKEEYVLRRNHCEKRKVLGIFNNDQGSFAEYITMPFENLFIVPSIISDEVATFVEPFAAAVRIIEQGIIKNKDKIAIIGDGRLGLLATLVCSLSFPQAEIVLIGNHRGKMELVQRENLRQKMANDMEDCDDEFDVVIVATGTCIRIHFLSGQ
mmetsp:Transcript_13795/g.16708  ORF Transcript_13795/g.16708 Transcript_13795/m.16708 type:complete len:253 (+) Transcript_13795:90-848(+)